MFSLLVPMKSILIVALPLTREPSLRVILCLPLSSLTEALNSLDPCTTDALLTLSSDAFRDISFVAFFIRTDISSLPSYLKVSKFGLKLNEYLVGITLSPSVWYDSDSDLLRFDAAIPTPYFSSSFIAIIISSSWPLGFTFSNTLAIMPVLSIMNVFLSVPAPNIPLFPYAP